MTILGQGNQREITFEEKITLPPPPSRSTYSSFFPEVSLEASKSVLFSIIEIKKNNLRY